MDRAVREAGWRKDEIGAVVVGTGPGSFTGIRAGVVTARTLAQALAIPLLPVSTFECYARGVEGDHAIIFAGTKDHFFVAAYRDLGRVETLSPAYLSFADLVSALSGHDLWLADAPACASLAGLGRDCQPLPVYENIAAIQAQIAWDRLSLKVPGQPSADDLSSLAGEYSWRLVEPLYVRGPSVTIKKTHGHSHSANDAG